MLWLPKITVQDSWKFVKKNDSSELIINESYKLVSSHPAAVLPFKMEN